MHIVVATVLGVALFMSWQEWGGKAVLKAIGYVCLGTFALVVLVNLIVLAKYP